MDKNLYILIANSITCVLIIANVILQIAMYKDEQKHNRTRAFYAGEIPGEDGKYYCHKTRYVSHISLSYDGILIAGTRPVFCKRRKGFCGKNCSDFFDAERTTNLFLCPYLREAYNVETPCQI